MARFLTFIDVSKWQGQTKWKVIKRAGIDFAYIRALKGYEVDPILAGNTKRCTNVELPHGQYGWWQPELDPLTQAKLLVELHYEHGSLLVPMLDVEENKEGMRPLFVRRNLRKTVDYIISKIGKPPTIYTAPWLSPSIATIRWMRVAPIPYPLTLKSGASLLCRADTDPPP